MRRDNEDMATRLRNCTFSKKTSCKSLEFSYAPHPLVKIHKSKTVWHASDKNTGKMDWHISRCAVLLHIEFWPLLGPLIFSMFVPMMNFGPLSSPLTFHNVNKQRGGSEEGWPQGIARGAKSEALWPAVGLTSEMWFNPTAGANISGV